MIPTQPHQLEHWLTFTYYCVCTKEQKDSRSTGEGRTCPSETFPVLRTTVARYQLGFPVNLRIQIQQNPEKLCIVK